MRGQIYNIDGLKIFTMGGASSHDKEHRKEGENWWAAELPTIENYEEASNNLQKNNWSVDLVITHCAPDSIQSQLADWYKHDELTRFLESLKNKLSYNKWYFGHYHIDRKIENKHFAIYHIIEKYER